MCTLRNFPTLINHCIEWARDSFDGYFVTAINDLKKFCENKDEYLKQLEKMDNYDEQIKALNSIIKYSKYIINKNYDDCIELAYNEYIKKFNNDIIQILTDYPPDSINEDGSKFWSANKRIPLPLPFDSKNKLIILYIKKYAEIFANSLSIPIVDDDNYIINKCLSFKTEEFIPVINKKKKNSYKKRYNNLNEDELDEEIKLKKKKKGKRLS